MGITKATENNIHLLLSGRHPQAKKYAGKHVMVIKDKVFPLRKGEAGLADFKKLKKKYGQTPVLTFVPRHDITYILFYDSRKNRF